MNALVSVAQDSLVVQKIDEVVLIATKYPTATKNIGKIIHKITAADLKENQHKTVSQLLNEVPGFELNGSNSAPGKNIAAYVRGGKSSQVLVVIDGIAVSDPSGINLSYDLNQISLTQIESIEVLKGAASTLYGSGAATAVIAIKTKKATAKSFAMEVGGSIQTNRISNDDFISGSHFIQNIAINGSDKRWNYLAAYSGTQANGISEASALSNEFTLTDDPFNTNSFLGKLAYQATDRLNFQMISSYLNSSHNFDGEAYTDVSDNLSKTNEFKVGLLSTFDYSKGKLTGILNYKNATRDYNQYSAYMDIQQDFLYESNSANIDVYNLYKISEKVNIISGVDMQNHNTNNETPYGNIEKKIGKFSLIDPYLSINLSDLKGLNFNAGTRLNWHNVYGTHTTFTLNPSYNFRLNDANNVKVLSSYSSAYIVPSIYQLFSFYGNENLTPEKSITFEAGIEYNMSNKLLFNALYFDRVEEDAIIFVTDLDTFVSNYANDFNEKIFVNGVESALAYTPIEQLKLKTNYTHTAASKVRTHSIPKHKWNSSVRYSFETKTALNLSHQYTSNRTQLFFSGFESFIENLDSYHLFNFSVSQSLMENSLRLTAGVDNIFNEDYFETIGYATKGRNLSLSFNYSF